MAIFNENSFVTMHPHRAFLTITLRVRETLNRAGNGRFSFRARSTISRNVKLNRYHNRLYRWAVFYNKTYIFEEETKVLLFFLLPPFWPLCWLQSRLPSKLLFRLQLVLWPRFSCLLLMLVQAQKPPTSSGPYCSDRCGSNSFFFLLLFDTE